MPAAGELRNRSYRVDFHPENPVLEIFQRRFPDGSEATYVPRAAISRAYSVSLRNSERRGCGHAVIPEPVGESQNAV